MNKNYIKSLINEMFDQNILNSEDDRNEIKGLIYEEGHEEELTGNFEEDLEYLKEVWEEEGPQPVVEEEDPEANIEKAVENLHVGFNYIPGIGIGYCKDEEDLQNMKNFVRGGMVVHNVLNAIFGL